MSINMYKCYLMNQLKNELLELVDEDNNDI